LSARLRWSPMDRGGMILFIGNRYLIRAAVLLCGSFFDCGGQDEN
jgi:hypothetical protein